MTSTAEQSQPWSKLLRARRLFAAAAVASALSLPSLALNAQAATITWTGAADGNWFNAANWSPAQVPTSVDAVVIDSNATVSVSGATSISFATLAIGDAAGNFSPTVRLSAAQSASGAVTIHRGAKLQQDTNQQIVFGALNVMPGGVITHTANSSARSFLINLRVTGDFALQTGAEISASGLGYNGGAGYQASGSGPGGGRGNDRSSGSGGGHGGMGGLGRSATLPGGEAYDSVTNPIDLGSGGGGAYPDVLGGRGGGTVLLNVGGNLLLSGLIAADGADGATSAAFHGLHGSGAGAGGTVNLTATTLSGTGVVRANGGNGGGTGAGQGGGGGGGGRIAITVESNDASSLTLTADTGAGGSTDGKTGGAGVVAYKGPSATNYNLNIGGLGVAPLGATPLTGAAPAFGAVTIANAIVGLDAGSTLTLGSFAASGAAAVTASNIVMGANAPFEIKNGGALSLAAQSIAGGALTVRGNGTFRQMNAAALNFGSVLVESGGLITHAANAASRTSILNLNVTGDFTVQAGATISASGLGYNGGAGYQASGSGPGGGRGNDSSSGSGGGHGGMGGLGRNATLPGGAGYDSVTNPTDLGSGGGGAYLDVLGGRGGGAVLVNVGGSLILNGLIAADGADGAGATHGSGGGAGGTVNLTASAISGTGVVRANGGVGGGTSTGQGGGGGGGGRIAITVASNDASSLSLAADTGAGGTADGKTGGAGVIAYKGPSAANYDLGIGGVAVTALGATPLTASQNFGTVAITNAVVTGSTVTLSAFAASGAAAVTASNIVLGAAAPFEVRSGASLNLTLQSISGGALAVRGGGTLRQMNAAALNFGSVLVESGGMITHAANSTARSFVVNLNVTGDFDLQAGATISASGLGYNGGAGYQASGSGPGGGPGNASSSGSGGGHGGAGGLGRNATLPAGAGYDSVTNPTDLGSGGGGAYLDVLGGRGGGAVLVNAGGNLFLNGLIAADGADGAGAPHGSGGGAGGTVNLTGTTISGAGVVRTVGGIGGGLSTGQGGGGGAGGRVAVTGCSADTVSASVLGGAGGLTGGAAGGAGSFAPTVPPSCPSAPPAPTDLAVVSSGENASGQTFLSAAWSPAAQALFYTLQASTASNFSGIAASSTVPTETATLAGLAPNSIYYLRVSAANGYGTSAFSAVVSTLTPVDLTSPRAPRLLTATGSAGGNISLAWTAATTGQQTAFFNLYRATELFTSTAGLTPVLLRSTATAYVDHPPSDGTYVYAVAGLDPSFNESGLSNALSALSLHAGPSAPQALSAAFSAARKTVSLSWAAPLSGTAVAYDVHRATFAFIAAPAQTLLASATTTAYVDSPPLALDATYFYRVAAVDAVGNRGTPSAAAAAAFDVHAPLISITRVVDGQNANHDLTPSLVITDFSSFMSTVTLNGEPFISSPVTYGAFNRTVGEGGTASLSCPTGTIQSFTSVYATSCGVPVNCGSCPIDGVSCSVLYNNAACGDQAPGCSKDGRLAIKCGVPGVTLIQPGAYLLSVQARDAFANASSATLSFTIDKSSPVIALTFPVSGSLINRDATAVYSLFDDFTATGALIVRSAAGQAPPFVFSSEGLNAVTLTATDLAGNVGAAAVTFTLDKTAPAGVTDLRVGDVRVGEVDLLWTAPSDALSGVAGYLVRVATYPITAGNFLGIPAAPAGAPRAAGTLETLTVAGDTNRTLYFAVRSTDAAGNLSALSNPSLLDSDPPILSGLSPAFGASVSRPTRVSVEASDLSGVASVVFTLDGVAVATRTVAPYFFDWATLAFADGEHSVGIRATDAAGNSVVFPGRYSLHYAPPPTPSIVSPASGFATFAATVTVTGAVEPGTTAQARVNGVPAGSAFAASGSFSVPVVLPVEGDYQLTVVAVDAKGQSGPSPARTVHYNLAPPNPPAGFSAETRAAGKVHLSWAVPGGKTPVSYRAYRSASATALSAGIAPDSSLRVASGLTGTEHDDMPSSDGVYYYGATALDSSGNESGLSEVVAALSDRAAPTAQIALGTGTVKAGQYPLTLTLSKPLASVPILLFVADGAGPSAVSLSASSPTVWTGTLTVAGATAYGPAAFQFQGTDFAGNSGTSITAGRTVFVDNRGPIGAVTLFPFPPLKAGLADLALMLDEPAASTPSLTFVTAAGTTVTVALEGAGTTWVSTIAVPSGASGLASFRYAATDALGNAGTTLSAGGSFVIDTTPTGAPLSLSAVSRPAGAVRLSWSGPIGEPAAAYRVYRDSAALPGTVAPAGDQTGRFDDAPAGGPHTYETAALDVAGNESARSNAAAALSDAVPPSAPAGSTAAINAFGRAEISWSAVAGETYRVHRTTYAPSNVAGTPFVVVGAPPFVDTPPQNGLIYYATFAVDPAGNLSPSASVVSVFFDRAPPVITITGVSESGLYNAPVFPAYSASDPALDAASVAGRLNGAPFASGAQVSAEGDYTLQVTAANLAAISSTETMHFSVDRTSPSIAVSGVVGGQTYHQTVIPAVNVTDARLASVVLLLDGAAYVAGTPVITDGVHSLVVIARDLAGNVFSSTTTFTLNSPPPPPPAFTVAAEEGTGAVLTWESPAADVAGYRAYQDGTPLHQGLLTAARFSDPAFVLGSARVYEVSAVDAAGQEGVRAKASLPAVSFALDGYGVTENGVAAFVRGFFDTVRVRASNASSSSKLVGPAAVELLSAGAIVAFGSAPSITVAAGAQGLADGVLAVPLGLPDGASLRVTLRLPVEPGSVATVRRTFPVSSRAPREPIVEVLPEPLVRGTNKSVTVKLHNQGSASLEVLSANPSDILVELRTPEGLVLSSARLSQTSNGAQTSPSGFFVPVPAGGSILLDPVSLFVPDALGASAQIRARVDRVFSNLVSGPMQGPRAFETIKPVSGVSEPPYRVSAAPALPLYDQDRTVIVTGEARDSSDQLVPGATVQVGVSLRGFDRVASTRTDGLGQYQITFSPAPGEAGLYTLWASHPDVVNRQPQSSFTIVGLGYRFSDFAAAATQNASVSFRLDLVNTGQTRVEGLSGAVLSSEVLAGASLTLDAASLPSSLEAGQSASLSLTAAASAAAALGRSRFTLRMTESHGFTRELPVFVDAAAALPIPSVVPQAFNVGLRAGQTRRLEARLKNLGTRDWQGVTLSAPALSWARIDGPTSLGDIPPGGEKLVAIVLEPPASLPSQAYASNPLVLVNATNAAAVPLNTLITITASGEGNVAYTIIDADKPRSAFGVGVSVPGAEATLVSLDVAGLSFRAVADSNGVARVLNVPQGRYSYTVRAAGYEDRSGTENIEPGVTLTKEIILPTNVVSYEWTVEPTTIQDKYNITLGITFKTDVPAPVVSVEPAVLNFALAGGQSADSQLTFENKGLITAFNVKVKPNITDPAITLDVPFDTIPELRPGQKVTVPFRIGLIHASCHAADLGIDYHYPSACGLDMEKDLPPVKITAGECYQLPTTSVGGGGSGEGFTSTPQTSGSTGFSLSVPASYISFAMPQPPAPSGGSGPICRSPKIKYPSECNNCDQIGGYSNPGGDPRVPESDLSLSVPKFGGSLDFTRVYDSEDLDVTSLGKGWTHSFAARISMFPVGVIYFPRRVDFASSGGAMMEYTGTGGSLIRDDAGVGPFGIKAEDYAELRTPSGRRLLFRHTGNGQFTAPVGEPSTLVLDTATASGYTWTLPDKTIYRFSAGGRLDTIKDRNNNTVTLGYDGSGLSTVRDPDNRVLYTFAHSGGKLLSVTDLAGRVVTFGYNGQGQLASASGPKGNTGYGYGTYEIPDLDANGFANGIFGAYNFVSLMTSVTSPNGHVTSFSYGPAAKTVDYAQMPMFQAQQASGGGTGSFTTGDAGFGSAPTTVGRATPPADKAYFTALVPVGSSYVVDTARFAQWFFSQRLLTLSESGPLGNYTFSHTIDELIEGGKTVVTDPRGFTETRTWENLGGRTQSSSIIDPTGRVFSIEHDSGRNAAKIVGPDGTTQVAFDPRGLPTSVQDVTGKRATIGYDPEHAMVTSVVDGRGAQMNFIIGANGNTTRVSHSGASFDIEYNPNGLPTRITDPLNHPITIGRDAQGNANSFTDALNRTTNLEYDTSGRMTSAVNVLGKRTSYEYNGDDYLVKIIDANFGETALTYTPGIVDSPLKVSSIKDSNNHTTQFTYDSRGRPLTIVDPLNRTRSYSHDAANNLLSEKNRRTQSIVYTYDALGRLMTESSPDGATSYEYDVIGNLRRVWDAAGSVQISYDPEGRPLTVQQTYSAANLTTSISYAYDSAGNRISMSLAGSPQPFTFAYSYDGADRLSTLIDSSNKTFAFTYDAAGRRTKLTYPNAVETNYAYDAANQLTRVEHKRTGGSSLAAIDYAYNPVGDRIQMTDAAGVHAYSYDDLRQLTAATHPQSSSLTIRSESFAYDAVGNRNSDAVNAGYVYDGANQLASHSGESYSYDADGNVVSRTPVATAPTSLHYNVKGQLVRVEQPGTTLRYLYDPLGRRIEKNLTIGTSSSALRYVYDHNDILAILNENNQLVSIFTHGPGDDEPLAIRNATGDDFYIHSDGASSVMAHTSVSGSLVERLEYQSFGAPIFSDLVAIKVGTRSVTGSPYAFGSREYESETGLYFMRTRYFDPSIGRFLSEDSAGDGAGSNLYAYVDNNPMSARDPSGQFLVPVIVGAWAVYEILASIYDLYSLIDAMLDPCVDPTQKAVHAAAFGGGLFLPGGGYTKLAKPGTQKLRAALKAAKRSGLKPIVIGRNMDGRVKPVARAIKAKYYAPRGNLPYGSPKSLANQKRWAEKAREEGRVIIDIGSGRKKLGPSPYYPIEQSVFKDYDKVYRMDLP